MFKVHSVKIQGKWSDKFFAGLKLWELRLNDRNYCIGDFLEFHVIGSSMVYTVQIVDVFDDVSFGLKDGYVILSLSKYYNHDSRL